MKTAIMGFGNPVRSDDAIGMYVIQELKKKIGENTNISIFDMGTSAFEVLFELKGHQKIILIDAVINSKEEEGTIFKLPAEEIAQKPQEDPLVFLHGMKWNQALSYAKKILQKEYPEDIQVYLVAIQNVKLDVCLSEKIKQAGNKIIEYILKDIQPLLSVSCNASS